MSKFPGWRTMTGAERYNAKMHALFEEARNLERERVAAGFPPNPNLTDTTPRTEDAPSC